MKKVQSIQSVTEGKTDILVFKTKESKKGPASRNKLPFYNPAMELNRDFSVVVCQWLMASSKKHMSFLDGLAASGIRGLRLASELKGDFDVTINDWDVNAFDLIKKNTEKLKLKNVTALNCNLNSLLSEKRFDYIDIDPFGSPVYFVDSAIRSIIHQGVIACTATDTAPLCGTYPKVCLRRYGANPFHCVSMKEVALRILIGFIAREAGKHDKGIKPIASYCTDHYFRVYVQVLNGTTYANESTSNYSTIKAGGLIGSEVTKKDIGPLWTGKINNKKALEELRTILFEKQLKTKNSLWKLMDLLEDEADAPMFFYTVDKLSSTLKKTSPRMDEIFESLRKKGYQATRTHFNPKGFKTSAPVKEIEKVFK